MDNNGSKFKKTMRKPSSKTTSAAHSQACNEAGVNGAVKMPKSSKKREKKNGNSEKNGDSSRSMSTEKKGDSSRSLSSGFPEHSSPAKIEEEYRALRHNYLILEEEYDTLTDEVTEVERDIEMLEAEKHALLDKLVVLEGLVDESDLE